MLGTSCLAESCGPYVRVVHIEYTAADLQYTNTILIIKADISNLLKICRPTASRSSVVFYHNMNKPCNTDYPAHL